VSQLTDIPRDLSSLVLAAARAAFPARNRFGVHAFGLGPRVRRGKPLAERALNVYVVRKLAQPPAPVPSLSVTDGDRAWTFAPNVIATGRRGRGAMARATAFSGVHPGAVISTSGPARGSGAIACVLATGGAPSHVVTAGHLFPEGAEGASVYAAPGPRAPSDVIGRVAANFLDDGDVDVAILELSAFGIGLVTNAGPSLSDYLPERSVWGQTASAFLATTNDYSRPTETAAEPLDALLSSPTRGAFWVRGVVATDGEVTNSGDSGTILCAGAANDLAVGVCAGILGAHSVFEPIDRAIRLAQQRIDSTLNLYAPG
jgi:hypothetical protein